MESVIIDFTGNDFVGIGKLTEQQAHYLFRKYAEVELDRIRNDIRIYKIDGELIDSRVVPSVAKAVDLPESNFFGFGNSERDLQIRIMKLCVILFFVAIDDRLYAQNIKSAQFGAERAGSPFRDVLNLLKPPEVEEPPPSTEAPGEVRDALQNLGFPTRDEITPELMMLQTELRLLRLAVAPDSEWQVLNREVCEEISKLLADLRLADLDDEQQKWFADLEELYATSICNRPLS